MNRKLLYVSAAWPPYEVPESDLAWQECMHLAERGFDVHVLTARRENVARPEGITVHAIMDDWGLAELLRVVRLVWALRPHAAMIWFLGWQYNYNTMITLLPALVKAVRWGAPFLAHFSNIGKGGATEGASVADRLRMWAFGRLGRWRYGPLLPLSDRLIVLSSEHGQKLAEVDAGLAAKMELIPPPPQINVLPATDAVRAAGRARLGLDDDAFVFTYFARLYPRKGLEMLIEAFAKLAADLPDARLAIIGGYHTADAWFVRDNYAQELADVVGRFAVSDRIVWSGEYSWDTDVASEYLRAADVAVLPFDAGIYLHNSSFAGVAAHALPTIACRAPLTDEPIVHEENVLLIAPRDGEALGDAMRRLYHDRALREKLGHGAQALAEEWFSWDRAATRLEELLTGGGAEGTSSTPPAPPATRSTRSVPKRTHGSLRSGRLPGSAPRGQAGAPETERSGA